MQFGFEAMVNSHLVLIGWGGWIRTNEWRLQRPLPYRLATPQCGEHYPAPDQRLSA